MGRSSSLMLCHANKQPQNAGCSEAKFSYETFFTPAATRTRDRNAGKETNEGHARRFWVPHPLNREGEFSLLKEKVGLCGCGCILGRLVGQFKALGCHL